MMFFVDTGDGVEYYDSEIEAKNAAEQAISDWLDGADGEWPEEVERVLWGMVHEAAAGVPKGNYIDYVLQPIKGVAAMGKVGL